MVSLGYVKSELACRFVGYTHQTNLSILIVSIEPYYHILENPMETNTLILGLGANLRMTWVLGPWGMVVRITATRKRHQEKQKNV